MIPRTLGFLLAAWWGMSSVGHAQPVDRAPAMLFHGNYCGIGNNAPLPPIDALDAACARHDACYPAGGLPPRSCNERLRWEADLISRDPRQRDDLRALAGFVASGVAVLPTAPDRPVAMVTTEPRECCGPRRHHTVRHPQNKTTFRTRHRFVSPAVRHVAPAKFTS